MSAWFDGSWRGEIHGPDRTLDLRDIRSIYVRRPTAFVLPSSMTSAEQRFAAREARRGIGGLLPSDCARPAGGAVAGLWEQSCG